MIDSSDYQAENKLEELLRRVDKPTLSLKRQEILKTKISRVISKEKFEQEPLPEIWLTLLVQRIFNLAKEIQIPSIAKALLREKLLTLFPRPTFWTFAWRLRPVAVATLVIFLFVTFFGVFGNPSGVEASPATYLSEFEGKVEILRNGRFITPSRFTRLKQKDVVKTHQGAKAVIRFPDDSLTRLSENTELRLRRMFVNPFDSTHTEVELELLVGKLWAKVVRVVSELSEFQVRASNTVLTAKKRAAFDVELSKGKAKVVAVQNTINVTVEGKKTTTETTLVSGSGLQVQNGQAQIITVPSRVKEEWITENIEQDKKYIEELAGRDRKDRLKQASEAPILPTQISQIFVLDPLEKDKAKLKAASARLAQAELLIEANHPEQAKKLLEDFQRITSAVASRMMELQTSDPEKASLLKQQFDQQFNIFKKQFTLMLPDDPLYSLKEAVSTAELAAISSPTEAVQVTLEQASEKLLEAQDLAASGKEEHVAQTLQQFTDTVTQAVTEATSAPEEAQEELATTFQTERDDHLKLLEALSAEVKFIPPPALHPGERRGIGLQEMISQTKKEVTDAAISAATAPPASLAASSQAAGQTASQTSGQAPSQAADQVLGQAPSQAAGQTPSQAADQVLGQVSRQATVAPLAVSEGPQALPTQPQALPTQQVLLQPDPKPLNQILRPRIREIIPDTSSGVTVITIEAKPQVNLKIPGSRPTRP